MASPLIIRPFTADDQNAAQRLVNEGLGEWFGYVDESCNPDLDDIATHFIAQGHSFVVAEAHGEVVGTGCLIIAPASPEGQMVRVSVRRDLRGQGIGRQIVEHLVAIARTRGLYRVWVETSADWTSAVRLYERCGFQQYARAGESVYLEFLERLPWLDVERMP